MIGVIHYNMGNITSVGNALGHIGADYRIVTTADEINDCSHLILPGVGAFAAGMNNLKTLGLLEPLKDFVLNKKNPFLGICLGMQLLFKQGTEGGNCEGLGFIDGKVERLDESGLRIPHVGWNTVNPVFPNRLISEADDFYFVHSYVVRPSAPQTVVATTNYGTDFASVVVFNNVFGAQFHPEKSHRPGLSFLKNFVSL